MSEILSKLDFKPMPILLNMYNLQGTSLKNHLFIKYTKIPLINNFMFDLTATEFFKLYERNKKRKNAKIDEIIRKKEFIDFYRSIGTELAIFILSECCLVYRNSDNEHILVVGKSFDLTKKYKYEREIKLKFQNLKWKNFMNRIEHLVFFGTSAYLKRDYDIEIKKRLGKIKLNCIYKMFRDKDQLSHIEKTNDETEIVDQNAIHEDNENANNFCKNKLQRVNYNLEIVGENESQCINEGLETVGQNNLQYVNYNLKHINKKKVQCINENIDFVGNKKIQRVNENLYVPKKINLQRIDKNIKAVNENELQCINKNSKNIKIKNKKSINKNIDNVDRKKTKHINEKAEAQERQKFDPMQNKIDEKLIPIFLSRITRRLFNNIFDKQILGIINKKIKNFCKLQKKECITRTEILRHFKITKMRIFVKNLCTYSDKLIIFERFIFNLFDFYTQIMAIYFYMTELSFCGLKIFYFKKNTWITEASKYIKSFITQFETLNKEVIRSRSEKVACYEEKQFPLIRLIPKEIGFRPVVNLSQRDKNLLSKNLENKLLQKILEHKTKNPLNESKNNRFLLAKELCKYRKEQNKSFIYMLKIDIKGCFDNIPHSKLKPLLKNLLDEDNFYLRYIKKIHLRNNKINYISKDFLEIEKLPFSKFLETIITNEKVIYCEGSYECAKRKKLDKQLNETIFDNIIHYKDSNFRQCKGIPQGSVLSTFLCNLYLEKLEDDFFSKIIKRGKLFRYVDDFLIMSPKKSEIYNFLILGKNLQEYGIDINYDKLSCNFDISDFKYFRESIIPKFSNESGVFDLNKFIKIETNNPNTKTDSYTIDFNLNTAPENNIPKFTYKTTKFNLAKTSSNAQKYSINQKSPFIHLIHDLDCKICLKNQLNGTNQKGSTQYSTQFVTQGKRNFLDATVISQRHNYKKFLENQQKYVIWCGFKLYGENSGIKHVYGEHLLYTTLYISKNPGLNLRYQLLEFIKRRMQNVFICKSNKFRYQNIFQCFILIYKKIIYGIKKMPFINKKYVLNISEEAINLISDLYMKINTDKDKLSAIIEQIAFTAKNKCRFNLFLNDIIDA